MRCVSNGWHEASVNQLPRVVLSFRPDVRGLYRNFFNGTGTHVRWASELGQVMGLQICMQKLIMDRDDRLLYARDLVNTLLASINNGRFSHAYALSAHLDRHPFELNMRIIVILLKSAPQHAKTFRLRRNTTLDAEMTSIQSLERKRKCFEVRFSRSPEEFVEHFRPTKTETRLMSRTKVYMEARIF